MRIYGYVVDTDNRGVEFANVYVKPTPGQDITIGTTTNKNGYYELLSSFLQDSVTIIYSMLGYHTSEIVTPLTQDVININIELITDAELLEQIEVRGIKRNEGTMDRVEATTTRIMPDATGGSIESILITFSGVNQNNELSSQYNVRGGSFDENEVYVNGIEVHRPLLIRSGQQEGLSFVNPEMVENIEFSAGGFNASYGDKMSSVLDITYKKPHKFEANLNASLLGAGVYVGHGDSTYSQMHGIRYKTSQYMLGALQTAGTYQPNFFDYQTFITWKTGRKTTHPWTMSFLGNYSQNTYRFMPDSISESFGTYQQTRNLTIYYDGQEKDVFRTGFAALSAQGAISQEVTLGFDINAFYTNEQETFDITGEYVLSDQPIDGSSTNTSHGQLTNPTDKNEVDVLGTGIYHQHARNSLEAAVGTLAHKGEWRRANNSLQWGINASVEYIRDQINEWEHRDSAGYSLPNTGSDMDLYYTMRGESSIISARMQAYVMNTHRWQTDKGQLIFNIGGRLNYWSFTNEVLPSPRANIVYIPGWKHDFSFRLATGLYYQAPFYKELRDTTTTNGITRFTMTRNLKAQRSTQVLIGADYYFRAWGRPFKFSAEAYYKYIDRMISYTVDNVRVRYSGKNDAQGYTIGLDLKLYGELVPGVDSWICLSAMSSKQRLLEQPQLGWIPSPQEQRYSFSMLFQDYLPQLPALRFHLKCIFSDGLPFSAPRQIETQKDFRTPAYKRVDIGATYAFNRKTTKFMRSPSAKHVEQFALQFEVFNLIGWKNVNSYFWVNDAYGYQWASPNYLTGRRYNIKLTIDLK